ncbi:MAG: hypothetical protein K0Q79_240 [Flavipsychrobacter sp.]|jgi:hypothetical protein|nr:hypothetical protein [Flavipsychrobacter sp.]
MFVSHKLQNGCKNRLKKMDIKLNGEMRLKDNSNRHNSHCAV